MEITLTIDDEQYSNEEIKKVIGKYKKSHEDMKLYSKNRYTQMKANLTSEDPDVKKRAEDHRTKLRENSLNYYKKKARIDEFVTNDKFKETIDILKTDTTTRRTAEEKYPELFQ